MSNARPADPAEPVSDDEFWSGLGYEGLAVVWGIDPSGVGADRRRTLTSQTIALRRKDPERSTSARPSTCSPTVG